MTLREVYEQYNELNKPYRGDAIISPEGLHKEILKHINSIGNSNPHWNKLNEIEKDLREFDVF